MTAYSVHSSYQNNEMVHTSGFVSTAGCKTQQEPDQHGVVDIKRTVNKVCTIRNIKNFAGQYD